MENQPAFSPDGKQVAFCWNGEKEDNIDVYVKLIGTDVDASTDDSPRPGHQPSLVS